MVHPDFGIHSICVFAMTLFSELPHDLVYYYKCVHLIQITLPDLKI